MLLKILSAGASHSSVSRIEYTDQVLLVYSYDNLVVLWNSYLHSVYKRQNLAVTIFPLLRRYRELEVAVTIFRWKNQYYQYFPLKKQC